MGKSSCACLFWVIKYLRGFDECDGDLVCVCLCLCVCVCVCVYGRPADLIKVCFNEHGLSNKNNGHLLQSACCVCVWGGAAAPLKPVTGVCETTTDNNGPPLVQVRLNDRELSRAFLKHYSESFRICVNTTNVSTLNGCLCVAQVCKSKGQRRIGVALGFVD